MINEELVKTHRWPVIRWILMLRPLVMTAALFLTKLALPSNLADTQMLVAVVSVTYILTAFYVIAHRLWNIDKRLIAFQTSVDIILITFVVNATGGYQSSFVGFYFLAIMTASLFFGRVLTVVFSVGAITLYTMTVYPDIVRYEIFPDQQHIILYQAFMYIVLMLAVGFFSSHYAERLLRQDTALSGALKMLKQARLEMSDILQSMTNGLVTVDISGRIVYMNNAGRQIFQVDEKRIVGKQYTEVFGARGDEFARVIEHDLSNPVKYGEREVNVYGREGDLIPVGLTSMPLYDTDGGLRGIIINFKDLTEKKKLLESIRQTDRMAAIGELSAAIAHELKNPLASLCGAVELLAESFENQEPHNVRLVSIIERESERLQRISEDFLRFARDNTPDIRPVQLDSIVEEVFELIGTDPRNTDAVTVEKDIGITRNIMFDHDHLKQVLLNLMLNSLDAMEGQGRIRVYTEQRESFENKYVRLIVSDTGPGFPKEALGHMFEPFFSTKKTGSGLGLAIVRKIVYNNYGRVFAQNGPDGGAEVALDILLKGED